MKTIKQKTELFNKLSENLEFDIMDYFTSDEIDNINSFDELEIELNENGVKSEKVILV